MTLKPLFKLDAKGKIREWSIKVIEDNNKYILETSNGLRDGKKIIHKREIVRAKSKKTIKEQAEAEALSKWMNKLNKELYTEKIPTMTKEEVMKKDKKLRPMLAQSYKNDKKYQFMLDGRVIGQAKLDGTRALLYYKKGRIVMESRNGIEYFTPVVEHITSVFEVIYKKMKCDNLVFDGELYVHNSMSFQHSQG